MDNNQITIQPSINSLSLQPSVNETEISQLETQMQYVFITPNMVELIYVEV